MLLRCVYNITRSSVSRTEYSSSRWETHGALRWVEESEIGEMICTVGEIKLSGLTPTHPAAPSSSSSRAPRSFHPPENVKGTMCSRSGTLFYRLQAGKRTGQVHSFLFKATIRYVLYLEHRSLFSASFCKNARISTMCRQSGNRL